ncbi:MAG: FHA domain-containing protein [Gallionella sp.]|nr:FHA domain-containing protein [Gallionella sp.]
MTAKLILTLDGALIQEYPLDKERMTIGRKPHNDIVINNLAVSGEHAAIITILHDSFLEDLESTNGLTVNGQATLKHLLENNDVIEIGKYKLKYVSDHVSHTNAADFEKTMVLRSPVMPAKPVAEAHGDTGYFQQIHGHVAGHDHTVKSASLFESHPHEDEGAADAVEIKGDVGKRGADADGQASGVPHAAETPQPDAVVHGAAAAPLAAIQILNGPSAGKELNLVKGLTTLGKPGVQVAVLTRRPHGFFITHVEGASFPSVNGQVLGGQPHLLNDHDLIELAGVKMEFYFKN